MSIPMSDWQGQEIKSGDKIKFYHTGFQKYIHGKVIKSWYNHTKVSFINPESGKEETLNLVHKQIVKENLGMTDQEVMNESLRVLNSK